MCDRHAMEHIIKREIVQGEHKHGHGYTVFHPRLPVTHIRQKKKAGSKYNNTSTITVIAEHRYTFQILQWIERGYIRSKLPPHLFLQVPYQSPKTQLS